MSEIHGTGEKGSLKDRLLHSFRKRKNSKLLEEEILLEEELEEKKKEQEKRKKELQFILIRNRFLEQAIKPTVSQDKVPISEVKRKVITGVQVVLAGMGLVAIGISGNTSKIEKEEKQEQEEIRKEENIEEKQVEQKEVEEVVEQQIETAKEATSLVHDTTDIAYASEQNLKKLEKRIDSLDRSLIESVYQTQITRVKEEHDEVKPSIKQIEKEQEIINNPIEKNSYQTLETEKIDNEISYVNKNAPSGLMSQISQVTTLENKRFSKLKLVKNKSHKLEQKTIKKSKQIEKRDTRVREEKRRTMKVNDVNYQLSEELAKQTQYINALKDRIRLADKNNNLDFKLTTTSSLMTNIFKLSMGILTLPFDSKKPVVPKLIIGSVLINHAIKGLKVNIFGDPNYQIYNEYRAFLNEISAGKSELETVQILLSDSLQEVDKVRENFKEIFYDYMGKVPEYDETLNKIDKIEQSLKKKQELLEQMQKTLNEEYENNKIKVKKMEAS